MEKEDVSAIVGRLIELVNKYQEEMVHELQKLHSRVNHQDTELDDHSKRITGLEEWRKR
ncbi:MAG TPA: hypothetical protein VFE50_25775 [Cyclobacteriaceae bacterium]|nr:hypothetical protein [Cyclobacteriaceae bacterium]